MRDTLFISHATPEDNEFTIWIASRLELLGYKIWLDKEGLLGGERFWKEIDGAIRNSACKVLLVYSSNICVANEPGELKTGINKEIELAESIASNEKLKDFIIPLHIDNSPYDLFVGSNMLNHIQFDENWAIGLEQLIKKLEKDNIPKPGLSENSLLGEWFENEYINRNSIIKKNELYYSSWWSVDKIPVCFYMHVFDNKAQADAIYQENNIPIGKISNILTSFEKDILTTVQRENEVFEIKANTVHQITMDELIFGFERDTFPSQRDSENHFKKLMKQCLFQLMKSRGLYWYELANRRFAYFYVPNTLESPKIKFQFPFRGQKGKIKTKSLFGKYKELGKWHYAISARSSITPFTGFELKSHIVFTDNGFKLWDDKEKIHSKRREKGRHFFNEEWRDMQLAFIQGLKDENDEIRIKVAKDSFLGLKEWPEMFWSDFGYMEPRNKKVNEILHDYFFDEE